MHCCHPTQDNTPTVCILFRVHMCGPKALPWLFIVVNRYLCIDFYEVFSTIGIFYCLLVRTIMSAVLFVVINVARVSALRRQKTVELLRSKF